MFNSKALKIFATVFIIGISISLVNFAFAQSSALSPGINTGNVSDQATDTLNKSNIGLNFAAFIFAKGLTLVSGFISGILEFGNQVIKLPVVALGFKVVLSFANLGFVLAIIIIAFATIFRSQSYAMKQTLWKLVAAALLVNFSLVIAGAIISVSNTFTNYFLSSAFNDNLGDTLAGALDPQILGKVAGVDDISFINFVKNVFTKGISEAFAIQASLVFILIFTFLILLIFIALAFMLLVRAISLSILLIIMPLVWLAWIFPSTSHHWRTWWNQFLRWVFFAPAMLFFVYVIVATQAQMADFYKFENVNTISVQEGFADGTVLPNGFFLHATQLIIMSGLLVGGLLIANKLSITGASTVYGWAQGTGKWTGKVTGGALKKAGLGAASRTMGSEGMKKVNKSLAASSIPFTGLLARGMNRIGVGAEQKTQKAYEDEAKRYTGDRLQNAILASSGARRAVLLNKAAKERKISDDVKKKYLTDASSMESVEKSMSRLGYNPGEIAKTIGYNSDVLKAQNTEKRTEAFNNLYDKFETTDWNKINPSTLLDDRFGEEITENLLWRSTASLSKILPKVKKGEDLSKIDERVKKVMDKMEKDAINSNSDEKIKLFDKIEKSLKNHLNSRIMGGAEEEKEETREESK